MVTLWFFAVMICVSCAQNDQNEVESPQESVFSAELVVEDLQIPWGMVILPDESILISEKSGDVSLLKDGNTTEIHGVPVG